MIVPFSSTKNVTLQDICFQPLYPDNKNCTISSVINYFQNDYENLIAKDFGIPKYPDHIYYCARYH